LVAAGGETQLTLFPAQKVSSRSLKVLPDGAIVTTEILPKPSYDEFTISDVSARRIYLVAEYQKKL